MQSIYNGLCCKMTVWAMKMMVWAMSRFQDKVKSACDSSSTLQRSSVRIIDGNTIPMSTILIGDIGHVGHLMCTKPSNVFTAVLNALRESEVRIETGSTCQYRWALFGSCRRADNWVRATKAGIAIRIVIAYECVTTWRIQFVQAFEGFYTGHFSPTYIQPFNFAFCM